LWLKYIAEHTQEFPTRAHFTAKLGGRRTDLDTPRFPKDNLFLTLAALIRGPVRRAFGEGLSVMRFLAFVLGSIGLMAFSASALAKDPREDPTPAFVEECAAPCAGYEISTELQNDWVFAADPSFLKSDVFQPSLTTDFFFAPTDYLKFVTSLSTESVVDSEPGENAIFEGFGTFVGELYAVGQAGPATVRAGKFDTIFSLASEVGPGINDTELVSNLDADERLGGEIILGFEGLGLNHALAATAFTTDRTILSESLFTNRGRTSLSDGGAGNTDGLSSFSIVLDGCKGSETSNCYADGEFGYRLGFRYQKAGLPTDEDIEEELTLGDELAYLAAATKSFELDEMTLRLLGEAAFVRHFDGRPDDALLLTGSAALEAAPLTYVATYTQQVNLAAEGPDTREHLADFEIIYASEEDTPFQGAKWNLGAAYTFARNADGENEHIFSVRAELDFGGNVEFGR